MNLSCPSCGATFFVQPEQLGPTGRKVRCGDCAHTWYQTPPGDEDADVQSAARAAAEPFAPAEPEAAEDFAAQEPVAEQPIAVEAPEAEIYPDEVEEPQDTPAVEERPSRPAGESERVSRRTRTRRPRPAPPRRQSSLVAGWAAFFIVVAALSAGFVFGRAQLVAAVPEMKRLYDLVGLPAEPEELGLELRDVTSVRRLVDGEPVVVIEGMVVNLSGQNREIPPLRASLTDSKGIELDRWTFQAAEFALAPGGTTSFETVAKNPPREGNLSIDFVIQ